MAMKGDSVAAGLLLAPVIFGGSGIGVVAGDESPTGVPVRANELLKQTNDYCKKLRNDGQKLAVEREDVERQREANLTDISNKKTIWF